jgi:hypothetical protein
VPQLRAASWTQVPVALETPFRRGDRRLKTSRLARRKLVPVARQIHSTWSYSNRHREKRSAHEPRVWTDPLLFFILS